MKLRSELSGDGGTAGCGAAVCGIVFDMDGVLLDSERVYESAWRIAAERLGLEDIDLIHSRVLGVSEKQCVAMLKNFYGQNFDGEGFWQLTSDISWDLIREDGMPLKPYAWEILSYLRGKGYRLALASSSGRELVESLLGKAGLLDFFDKLVCGDEISFSKPHPEIYQKACAALGLEPGDCLAVEDSPNGILSAYSAGLKCIMVPDRIPCDDAARAMLFAEFDSLEGLRSLC